MELTISERVRNYAGQPAVYLWAYPRTILSFNFLISKMGIIPMPRGVIKIKWSNSGTMPCSMCLDSVNVISAWWLVGTEVRKESGVRTCQEILWEAAFTSVSSGWLWGEVRDHFVLGKIITEDSQLPSILAAQRKAFNFPYFRLGDCNLHLQENEGVIFLVSRHLGWFMAALEVVNGNWGSSSFWRQARPCQGPG